MAGERFVVLGLARARAAWFGEVSRWATSGAIPAEFLKCLSVEELRARLASGRPHSAVLLDAGLAGIDRDLLDAARGTGAVLVVDDPRVRRDWPSLGATAVLPHDVTSRALLDALEGHARRIGRGDAVELPGPPAGEAATLEGRLVAVTGAGGTGTSVVAIALARALAVDPASGGLVALADLALDADQALLHDVGDVVPGLPELVEAHRAGRPSPDAVRDLTFFVAESGYHLLLGLRRHHEWTAVRPRAFEAALAGLRAAFRVVVADLDGDVEGEAACGSVDVEERNTLARATTARAGAVVVVGGPAPHSVARLARHVAALGTVGVDLSRVIPVVNRAPRRPRWRAERSRVFAELVAGSRTAGSGHDQEMPAPLLFLGERRRLDEAIHDGTRLPPSFGAPIARAVDTVLHRSVGPGTGPGGEPVPVAPGSLGSWTDERD